MGGFIMTPGTHFDAEVLQHRNNAANGKNISGQSNGKTNSTSFAGTVQEKLAQKEGEVPGIAAQSIGRNEAAVQAMSREEYKFYIYQKIAQIPMDPSQKQDMVSVYISEEGFAAMQADPAYERWVLDTLRKDFSAYNSWSNYTGGSYRAYYFGATRQEYKSESFSMGVRREDRNRKSSKKKEKSYWEKRAERHKLYMDLQQKAWYKRENEQQYRQQIDFQRREVSSALLRQWAMEQATGEEVELDVNPSVLSQAATDYAQRYVFFKIPSALVNPRPKTIR